MKTKHYVVLKGIITTDDGGDYRTTMQGSYTSTNSNSKGSASGIREQILKRDLYELVESSIDTEEHSTPPQIDYTSVTHKDFNFGGIIYIYNNIL